MGIRDSSRTRVQPIFKSLLNKDPSGNSWLPGLLALGSRGSSLQPVGTLLPHTGHRFEYSAAPPREFLEWLVVNPERLGWPTHSTSELTRRKRKGLQDKKAEIVREALDAIRGPQSHQNKWWCLEGTTKVDCAFFTDRMVIFIEGKRTELGPSKKVSWYEGRNQVHRNLECARAYAVPKGLDYRVLLILEENSPESERYQNAQDIESPESIQKSFPHLPAERRSELLQHYCGFTTWQDIGRRFTLGPECFPDRC